MRFFLKKRIYLIENKLSRKPKEQHGFVLKISHSIVFYAFSLEVSKIMPIFAAEQ